jgi:hypothetical protein
MMWDFTARVDPPSNSLRSSTATRALASLMLRLVLARSPDRSSRPWTSSEGKWIWQGFPDSSLRPESGRRCSSGNPSAAGSNGQRRSSHEGTPRRVWSPPLQFFSLVFFFFKKMIFQGIFLKELLLKTHYRCTWVYFCKKNMDLSNGWVSLKNFKTWLECIAVFSLYRQD